MYMIINRADELEKKTNEELEAGYIKFNIPDEDNPDSLNGEGVWGWCTPEDKAKYDDDNYTGKIEALLCNAPINYMGELEWGDKVQLRCHGSNRPTLDPEWVQYEILDKRK